VIFHQPAARLFDRLEHAIPPLLVVALVAAAMWSIAALGPQLPIAPGARRLAVVLLTATGVAFVMLGVLAFRASRTTVDPLHPERAAVLVTGGVYRVTRNPMYVGMAFLLLAWAVNLASVLPFLGVVVFVLYITRLQIQPEERALQGLFGDAYSRYAARVRRWL
jgi:protein-S-isoprenylcysteine O-methyltransferase Ste14